MTYQNISEFRKTPTTALLYCSPGIGKSTALGLIAEKSKGKTLVLDVDRTIINTLQKGDVVKDTSRVVIRQIDNIHAWEDWIQALNELKTLKETGKLDFENICIDNLSELERCILSDLGSQGKNKGVPAQADYQYMQFKLVNSLRFLKSLGVNVYITAWEDIRQVVYPDGTSYSQFIPKVSLKIVDNICGLCDIVGKILAKQDGTRGIILEATQSTYAKNQKDTRKGCLVEEFIKGE